MENFSICKISNDGAGGDTHINGSVGSLTMLLVVEALRSCSDSAEPTHGYLEQLMDEAENFNDS